MSDPQSPQPLSAKLLLQAYAIGYFPMSDDRRASETFWVRPDMRAIIPFDQFHVSKSLRKAVKKAPFCIRYNTAFEQVMLGCAAAQPDRPTTWINDDILTTYAELHREGYAHSIEAWLDDTLVGGLYGVSIGAAFFGESMFSTQTNASKICLVHLVARLVFGRYLLLDTQFQNDHLVQFGTTEIPHKEYEKILRPAITASANFNALDAYCSGSTILQSLTQTS